MTYANLADRNLSQGIQVIFVYANDITQGIFTPLLLGVIFTVLCLGSYFSQKRQTGEGDFPVSFAVAGYVTLGVSLILSLAEGAINLTTIIIVLLISILGTGWLYFSRNKEG